jgi:hypothetical protein
MSSVEDEPSVMRRVERLDSNDEAGVIDSSCPCGRNSRILEGGERLAVI